MFKIVKEDVKSIGSEVLEDGDYVIVCSNNNNLEEERFISYLGFKVIDNEKLFNKDFNKELLDDDDYCDEVDVVGYCDLIIENWVEDEGEVVLIRLS